MKNRITCKTCGKELEKRSERHIGKCPECELN